MRAFPTIALIVPLAAITGCTSIQTEVVIDAPPAAVRKVLYDVGSYPQWNPFIVKLDGPAAAGRESAVTVQPVGKPPLSGKITFVTVNDTELSWKGGLAFPGLYSGQHEFVLETHGEHTIVHQNEKMAGIIIPFFNLTPTEKGFRAMNFALKARVEGQ